MGPAVLARFIAEEHMRDLHAHARAHQRARRAEPARARLRTHAVRAWIVERLRSLPGKASPRAGTLPEARAHDPADLTVRLASAPDALALAELAQLDEAPALEQPALVAQIDGRISAALSLNTGSVIADPFVPSEPLIAVLRLRAAQLERVAPQRGAMPAGAHVAIRRWPA